MSSFTEQTETHSYPACRGKTPSVALRSRRFGTSSMPSRSASESISSRERAGSRASPACPRRAAPSGSATRPCRGRGRRCESSGSSWPWRSMNIPIPSHSASSEVERNSTRTDSVGSATRARARAISATQPVPLSLAPGTTSREPMSAMKPTVPAEIAVPAAVSARLPSAAPAATSAGAGDHRPHQRRAGVVVLEYPGGALGDGLGDRRVEEEAAVGGVVMGHQDHRPLGVGRPELGQYVVGGPLGQQASKAPPPRRHLVGGQRCGRRARCEGPGAGEATAAHRRDAGSRADRSKRPPARPRRSRSRRAPARSAPAKRPPAQLAASHSAASRSPGRRGGSLDRRELARACPAARSCPERELLTRPRWRLAISAET